MSDHSLSPTPGAQQRKAHRCRTCHMPMKGHTRNGCPPYAHSDAKGPGYIIDDDDAEALPNNQMEDAMLANGKSKPTMPGAFGGRPSDISSATDSSPTRSLRERIGIKLESDDVRNPRVGNWIQESQYGWHQSAPPLNFPNGQTGRTKSLDSGSTSSSSSTSIAPNHSVSQRQIHRDRTKSEATKAYPKRQLSRLGSILSGAEIFTRNNELQNDDLACDENPGLEDDDENGDPSDGSTVNGASSVSSWYASESDAGTFSSSGGGSSISFGALMRGSGAAPLMTAYEIGAKYVPFMQTRANDAGFKVQVLPRRDDDERDSQDLNSSSREPGMVRIVISRDDIKDIFDPELESKPAKWAADDGHGPNDPLRRRKPEDVFRTDVDTTCTQQTPGHIPNAHSYPTNPQMAHCTHPTHPTFAGPYATSIVPQQRSWILDVCMLFFVVVFAVIVGAVITILVLDRLPVPE